MSMSKQEVIKTLISIGNGIQGHKVSSKNKADTIENVRRVFANARRRINAQNNITD